MGEIKKFRPDLDSQSIEWINRLSDWAASQQKRGFVTRMHQALIGSIVLNPEIMVNAITEIRQVEGGQTKSQDLASFIYPLEASLRLTAMKNPEIWGKPDDPLSTASWRAVDIINILVNCRSEVVKNARENTMAKNMPHRAALVLKILKEVGLSDKPINLIELGSSSGLILTALQNQSKFSTWFRESSVVQPEIQNQEFMPLKDIRALGIDLNPPSDDWVLACTDDDKLRTEIQNFMKTFGDERVNVIRGDALKITELEPVKQMLTEKDSRRLVIFIGMFLYQLPKEKLESLKRKLSEIISDTNGVLIIADSRWIFDKIPTWNCWAENSEKVISPVLKINEKPLWGWATEDQWPTNLKFLV